MLLNLANLATLFHCLSDVSENSISNEAFPERLKLLFIFLLIELTLTCSTKVEAVLLKLDE